MIGDVSSFQMGNVVDTCAVWHLLSSRCLYNAAISRRVSLCITNFVLYEALFKARSRPNDADKRLKSRLAEERKQGQFIDYHLDIDDLQEVEILQNRRRLSKGELSTLAFAKKTTQAVLTDDRKAWRLAREYLSSGQSQSVPHLLGWLFFDGVLADHEIEIVKNEHQETQGTMGSHFQAAYEEALRCKLVASKRLEKDDR
jgi:hypothetical protein